MLFSTIGVDAKAPEAPSPWKVKRHFTLSFDTFCAVIDERVVARVFWRS